MGWKVSSIIVSPKTDIDFENLLEEVGFTNFKEIEEQPYDVAVYPEPGKIYIGVYKNNLILSNSNLPSEFFSKTLSALEEKLIALFPNSEICAVSLNSVINHWAYAVIKQGKKIRVRGGDYDRGTILDFGEPLQEELELLSKSKLDDNGERKYYFDKSDEFEREDQVGENFVFEIFKRYTGNSLEEDDELMYQTYLKGYEISTQNDADYFDKYFSGEWDGYYVLGNGYRESVKGQRTNFLFKIKVNDGLIQGTAIDEDKQADAPGIISGFIVNPFINFKLKYPIYYFFDQNGLVQKDKSKSYEIAYTGLFDISSESFKGIWNIENTKCWGEWFMKKKQG